MSAFVNEARVALAKFSMFPNRENNRLPVYHNKYQTMRTLKIYAVSDVDISEIRETVNAVATKHGHEVTVRSHEILNYRGRVFGRSVIVEFPLEAYGR